jgi:spermidine synthase
MTPYLIFLFAGFSTVVIQTLFIREMLVVFQGNELSVGIILSQWLAGTAIGNFAAARLDQGFPSFAGPGLASLGLEKGETKDSSDNSLLASSYVLSAVVLFMVFFLTRDLRTILHIFPGEGISLKVTYFASLVFLVPLAAVTGAQFTLAFSHIKSNYPAASGYLFESAGYFAGGIVFTYLVLPFFTPSAVIMFLCALLLTAGAFAVAKPLLKKLLFALAAIIVFALPWASRYFENLTLAKLYSGFNVLNVV